MSLAYRSHRMAMSFRAIQMEMLLCGVGELISSHAFLSEYETSNATVPERLSVSEYFFVKFSSSSPGKSTTAQYSVYVR